jgi:hypothetical protein
MNGTPLQFPATGAERILPVELIHRPRRRGRFGERFHALRVERPPFMFQTLRERIARLGELVERKSEEGVDLLHCAGT